ncbi:hypothetical protein DFH27DRAFT_329547 [Peziza echinospora]|nr:hypothetical protein DFH27DRAFT_329547 [Peziza echinospora]
MCGHALYIPLSTFYLRCFAVRYGLCIKCLIFLLSTTQIINVLYLYIFPCLSLALVPVYYVCAVTVTFSVYFCFSRIKQSSSTKWVSQKLNCPPDPAPNAAIQA